MGFVLRTLSESDMRASSELVLSLLFLLCSQRHLASAILPPFAIAAVEAMWAKRIANSASTTAKVTTIQDMTTTNPSTVSPQHTSETKLPEMILLHQVLPKDANGNKKMVETFLEGKMMLTDPMNVTRTEQNSRGVTKTLEVHQGVLGVGGLGGLYPAVRHYATCHHNGPTYDHGDTLVTDHPCDHCQCRNGKVSCYWQVCDGSPDFNCVPLFVPGTCCPVYSCGGVGNDNKNNDNNINSEKEQSTEVKN